jgi:dTDP-4-dehydrorhamnose reductase
MKILILGSSGQVGMALKKELSEYELLTPNSKIFNLANSESISEFFKINNLDLIINLAAYNDVDGAEVHKELAYKINSESVGIIARHANLLDVPFIHFSTNFIFDGIKTTPYSEDDLPNPLGVYGKSKLEGEKLVLNSGCRFYIFRTSWIYSNFGSNFYNFIRNSALNNNQLNVVDDQFAVPTCASFLAKIIKIIIPKLSSENCGIYHLVPNGFCSKYNFARSIISTMKHKSSFNSCNPVKTSFFKTKAKRPLYSVLNNEKIKKSFMLEFFDWELFLKKHANK